MVTSTLDKITCACGKVTARKGVKGHLRSNKHLQWQKKLAELEDPNNSTKLDEPVVDPTGLTSETKISEEVREVLNNPELLAKVMEKAKPGPTPLLPEEEALLQKAREYEDPIRLAKELRSVFSRNDWPNEEHPGNQLDWLKEHNIPIRTLPRHLDSDGVREYMNQWHATLQQRGWGSTWEIK